MPGNIPGTQRFFAAVSGRFIPEPAALLHVDAAVRKKRDALLLEETALDVFRQLHAADALRESDRSPRHVFSQTADGIGSEHFALPSRRFLGPTLDMTGSLPVVSA